MLALPSYAKIVVVNDNIFPQYPYIAQERYKFYADNYTSRKWVLILENDLVFKRPIDADCFFENNKVHMMCRKYWSSTCTDTCNFWQKGTEAGLKMKVEDECMFSSPFIYPRALFPKFRNHVTKLHNFTNFDEFFHIYIKDMNVGWSVNSTLLSEFQLMNVYGITYMQDMFHKVIIDGKTPIRHPQCSEHIHMPTKREGAPSNPKLTAEFFDQMVKFASRGACLTLKEKKDCMIDADRVRAVLNPGQVVAGNKVA